MNFEVIPGEQAFTILESEWDNLVQRGMTDTPFQSLNYQRAWWHNLHPENARLYTFVGRDLDGSLMAILPIYLEDTAVHFNGCVEETDYLDIIVEAGHAKEAWSAVFDCLLAADFPQWHIMELCNIPAASLSRSILPDLAAARSLTIVESIDEVCPVIQLPQTFDDYLNTLDGKQRREVRRKMRRAAGADLQLQIVGPDDNLDQAVDDFLELLQMSTHEKRDWLNEGRRALFHETTANAQANGTLQLMFIVQNGRKAAALLNFDYRERIWVYNSGLDPQAYASLSPGVVLTAKAIEWAIENGRAEFDFLRGSETYKYRFGAKDTQIYRLQLKR